MGWLSCPGQRLGGIPRYHLLRQMEGEVRGFLSSDASFFGNKSEKSASERFGDSAAGIRGASKRHSLAGKRLPGTREGLPEPGKASTRADKASLGPGEGLTGEGKGPPKPGKRFPRPGKASS
jgi:hypothetical protein